MFRVFVLCVFVGCANGGTPSGLYQDDGAGHTILAQKFSKRDVREMSFDLLSLMGFENRPHPHLKETRSPASDFLHEVYVSLAATEEVGLSKKSTHEPLSNLNHSRFHFHSEEMEAIKQADAIVSFLNRGHRYASLVNVEEEKAFWFDVSEIPATETVLSAELRLWKKSLAREEDGDAFRIVVSAITKNKNTNSFELIELDEVISAAWEGGWLRLNVSESFRGWIQDPETNYGLALATGRADSGVEVSLEKSGLAVTEGEDLQPFIVSFLVSPPGRRARRNNVPNQRRRVVRGTEEATRRRGRKTKKGGRNAGDFIEFLDRPRSCQMGMLYVNFEDLGWKDWVIAPDGFIAYYCTGECSFPLTAAMNATNHAIVSTLVHTYYPQEFPKPACAPLKLGSISMLYYDDNSNVTVKKYKDMVIKSCGCK